VGLGAGLEAGSGHGWRWRSRQRALKRERRQPPAGSRALVLWEVATISLGRRPQERTSSRSNSCEGDDPSSAPPPHSNTNCPSSLSCSRRRRHISCSFPLRSICGSERSTKLIRGVVVLAAVASFRELCWLLQILQEV
jgi:hypothetical protein